MLIKLNVIKGILYATWEGSQVLNIPQNFFLFTYVYVLQISIWGLMEICAITGESQSGGGKSLMVIAWCLCYSFFCKNVSGLLGVCLC